MSSQIQKRKHKTLTIKEKNDILDRLNGKESYSSLANEYGVGRSTIYEIKKNRDKIKKYMSTLDCGRGKRQTLKKSVYPEVDEALYTWFLKERHNKQISGSMLATKAKFFYKEIMKKDDFVASKGWLDRFKSRYGIRLMTVPAQNLSNDTTVTESFKLNFLQKVKDFDLKPSQVYNAATSGLFWRVVPSKKNYSDNDKSVKRKMSKECVTILTCANAAGTHALKMVVVGKTNNPNALKNIDLPVHYYGQKSALMTKELVEKWFNECFVEEVTQWLKNHNLPQKALLLLHNAHVSEDLKTEDKCISTMFLPENSTKLFQPMYQHIQFIKQDYKKNLLVRATSKNQSIDKTLKEFNLKDLVFDLCQSWIASHSTINSSWNKLWPDIVTTTSYAPQNSVTSEVIEKVAAATQISSDHLKIWCRGMDKDETVFHEISDERITIKNEEDDVDVIPPSPAVVAEDAINAFEVGLQWAEENGSTYEELLILRKLRDKALTSRLNNK